MFRYPYTSQLKRKEPKAKPAKEQRLSSLGASRECSLRERDRVKTCPREVGLQSCTTALSRGELQRSCSSPSLVQHHPGQSHVKGWWRKPAFPRSGGGSCTHLPVPDSGRGLTPRRSPACHPHMGVSAPYLPRPSCTDHTARVSASIFCSPCRFSSSWTWATFCRIAISGPPP